MASVDAMPGVVERGRPTAAALDHGTTVASRGMMAWGVHTKECRDVSAPRTWEGWFFTKLLGINER